MITGEIKEVSPVNGNIIDLPPISASIGNVSITVQTGGAVNSVNGKTGKVVLTAEDVGALPYDTELRVIMPFYENPSQEQKDEIIDIIEKIKSGGGNLPVFMDAGGSLLPAEYRYNTRYDVISAVSHGNDSGVSRMYIISVSHSGTVTTSSNAFFATNINTGGEAQAPTVQAVAKYVEEQLAEGSQSGVQPDLSQNDPEAADYVKNRTHWIENAFEPIVLKDVPYTAFDETNTIADLGFGTFYKITDTILTREQLESATIEANSPSWGYGYNRSGDSGKFTYNEEYSAMLGIDVFNYVVWGESLAEEYIYGLAANATESGSLLGGMVNIPSAGLYMSLSNFLDFDLTIKDEAIHTLSEDYFPSFYRNYFVELSSTKAIVVKVDGESCYIQTNDKQSNWLKEAYCCQVAINTSPSIDIGERAVFITFKTPTTTTNYHRIGIVCFGDVFYVLDMECLDDEWQVSVKSIPTAKSIETAITSKGYQTESQVKTLINEAIGVIENGSY